MTMITIDLDDRQLATILTALRYWHRDLMGSPFPKQQLRLAEIEALCKHLGDPTLTCGSDETAAVGLKKAEP